MKPSAAYDVRTFFLKDDGIFPNNILPAVLYKQGLDLPSFGRGNHLIRLFHENNWKNTWKNGVYDFHHYHSNTHEVLGAYRGKIIIQLGGEFGEEIEFEEGDVLIIPAGVSHKNLTSGNTFKCVGAYPDGANYDMNYGKEGERPQSDQRIKSVPLPQKDPLFGRSGALMELWF